MADDDTPPEGGKTFTQEDLDRKIEERLKRERAKYADYDQLKARVAELEAKPADDGDTGEVNKLTEQLTKLQKDLDDERLLRLKAEVAADKGLTPAQAKRLTGSSKEELEADADDLLDAFPAPSKEEVTTETRRPPTRRPAADLKGGSTPEETPTDVKSLVDSIPPTA